MEKPKIDGTCKDVCATERLDKTNKDQDEAKSAIRGSVGDQIATRNEQRLLKVDKAAAMDKASYTQPETKTNNSIHRLG